MAQCDRLNDIANEYGNITKTLTILPHNENIIEYTQLQNSLPSEFFPFGVASLCKRMLTCGKVAELVCLVNLISLGDRRTCLVLSLFVSSLTPTYKTL